MNHAISDHGEDDPVPFEFDPATARFTDLVIQIHRTQLNDRDKARQMFENERALAEFTGDVA